MEIEKLEKEINTHKIQLLKQEETSLKQEISKLELSLSEYD